MSQNKIVSKVIKYRLFGRIHKETISLKCIHYFFRYVKVKVKSVDYFQIPAEFEFPEENILNYF